MITICITTYNRANLLENVVSRVLSQSYQDFEIIIVNDCSPDNTDEVGLKLAESDNRIKYLKHSENKGLAAARNTAINNANRKYFTFVDDDDLWEDNFLEFMFTNSEKYDDNWCFCSGFTKFYNEKKVNFGKEFEGTLKDFMKIGYTPPVGSQFYHLSSLKKIGGYNEKIKSGVDHDLWIRLLDIDLNLKSFKESFIYPNKSLSNEQQMTGNIEKRLKGINNSLQIWKESLIKHYGEKFYLNFVEMYRYNNYKKFVFNELNAGNYFKAMILLLNSKFPISITKEIFRLINQDKKIKNSNEKELFIEYKPSLSL